MPEIFGEHVDRLVTIEMKRPGIPSRGVILPLYEAARRVQKRPLTLLAAEKLKENVTPGQYVLIATGSGKAPWRPAGETDGPLGAVSLARAIKLGLGGRPCYVAGEPYMPPVAAASDAAGITATYLREMADYDGFYPTALMRNFPLGHKGALDKALELLDELKPAAVISIESLGPNAQSVIHSMTGYEREAEHVALTYHLVEQARKRGIFTLGIGDYGNEVGFGLVAEELKKAMPGWAACKCPCGGSPLCEVTTDVVAAGSVSNWVGYGISACLAYLCQDINVLQDEETERRMGVDCVYAGAEGEGGMKQPWVDGTRPQVQEAIITMLRMLVENAIQQALERGW